MRTVRVVQPGMLTTVQDLGRPGWASVGVPVGGAADALSARIGNRLVGAPDNAGVLEMTLVGATLTFECAALIAVTGGETHTVIEAPDGAARTLAPWRGEPIRAGERVRIGPVVRGCRAYLCVEGGFVGRAALGSIATHLGAGFGGVEGRALRAGDALELGPTRAHGGAPLLMPGVIDTARAAIERRTLRVVPGAHAERFSSATTGALWKTEFAVSVRSDRVGVRLEGQRMESPGAGRLPSEAMPHGAVQIPENGEPIVLGVDHPTTGGYPVIACVTGVDLPALGQLRPGDRVRFEAVSLEEARRLRREQRAAIDAEAER